MAAIIAAARRPPLAVVILAATARRPAGTITLWQRGLELAQALGLDGGGR
jgi:hypothetical protein